MPMVYLFLLEFYRTLLHARWKGCRVNSYENALSERQRSVLQCLRPLLQTAGQPEPDMRKITITECLISEFPSYDGLTQAILNHDMPEKTSMTVLDHYTNNSGFKGIMTSQALFLAPITQRLGQGELDTFALEHSLIGYTDANGKATKELVQAAADLFYTSFTEPPTSQHLWACFGSNGNGYRLRFEVTPGNASHVRAVRYQGSTTLLRQINDALTQAGLPRFVMKGVSRVGAFYLPSVLQPENEVRLLAKRFQGGGAPVIPFGGSERWPVEIGIPNMTASLTLTQIGVRRLDSVAVKTSLPTWCATVPVVSD